MRTHARRAVWFGTVLLVAFPGTARPQTPFAPVSGRWLRSGTGIALDIGGDLGDQDAFFTAAFTGAVAVGPLMASGMVSMFGPAEFSNDTVFGSVGGLLDLEVIPWEFVSLQVGAAYSDSRGVERWHVPIGLSLPLATTITDDLAGRWWGTPRLDVERRSSATLPAGEGTSTRFAFSSGILVEWSSGWGFRLSFDKVFAEGADDNLLTFGAHRAFGGLIRGTAAGKSPGAGLLAPLFSWLFGSMH